MKRIYFTLIALFLSTALFAQVQVVDTVLAVSSEYGTSDFICSESYSACRITGNPDVYPGYGDDADAWSPATADDNREFIVVGFATPAFVDTVYIYETYNPGAVDTVYVRNAATGAWEMVWSGTAFDFGNAGRIFKAGFPMTTYLVDAVRLALNSPAVEGYNEIDAVSIGGIAFGTAVETVGNSVDLDVYPNPTTGSFTIHSGNALVEAVRIKDVTGREVYALENVNATTVKLDRVLSPGVYFVEAAGKNFKRSVKLLVD